jgi:hypothetical protein
VHLGISQLSFIPLQIDKSKSKGAMKEIGIAKVIGVKFSVMLDLTPSSSSLFLLWLSLLSIERCKLLGQKGCPKTKTLQ